MHSKTQYLAAANLWDAVLSRKYPGIHMSNNVQMLFEQNEQFGSFVDEEIDDQVFQETIRAQCDAQAVKFSLLIQPEDEFQLIGWADGVKEFPPPMVGSSQLSVDHDGKEYIFSLHMTGEEMQLKIIKLDSMFLGTTVFNLKLVPQAACKVFYATEFQIKPEALHFHKEINALMVKLIYLGDTVEFQVQLSRWQDILRKIVVVDLSKCQQAG